MRINELLTEKRREGIHYKGGSTDSANKTAVSNDICQHVRVSTGHNMIALMGPTDKLEAHLNEARKVGIDDLSKLWVIEIHRNIHEEQVRAFKELANKRGYTTAPHFINSELVAFLEKWDPANGPIDFVDFDGTMSPDDLHMQLIDACKRLNVKYLSLIGAARGKIEGRLETFWDSSGREKSLRLTYISVEEQLELAKQKLEAELSQIPEDVKRAKNHKELNAVYAKQSDLAKRQSDLNFYELARKHNDREKMQYYSKQFINRSGAKLRVVKDSPAEILRLYAEKQGATSLLDYRNYKGAGSDDGGGSPMFVYLFKL